MSVSKEAESLIELNGILKFPSIPPEKLTMLGYPPWKIMDGTLRVCGDGVFVVQESDNLS